MPVPRLVRSVLFLAGACAPVALLGCGSSTAEVSGAITFNGQPPKLKGVQISFIATDGRMASTPVAEDGAYKADAVPVGEVGVAFIFTPIDPIQQGKQAGPKLPKAGGVARDLGPQLPPTPNPIPMALRDASTSKVTFKVEGGKKNVFKYDIKP